MQYTYGFYDIFCVLFYCLVCIVSHGIVQQYLLDRSARKLHLSKIKHSKFNESGQLLTFYIISILWTLELLRRDKATRANLSEIIGGPQDEMQYGLKLYFIFQIAYWLHCFPEFYLERVRKEEVSQRIVYVSLYLASFVGAYLFNVTRLALVLVLLHYVAEATFHSARILYFRQNDELHPLTFKIWNVVFVAARFFSVVLSVLVLALGFGASSGSQPSIVKYAVLGVILALQTHLMWKYLVFHLGRMRPVETDSKKQTTKAKSANKEKAH